MIKQLVILPLSMGHSMYNYMLTHVRIKQNKVYTETHQVAHYDTERILLLLQGFEIICQKAKHCSVFRHNLTCPYKHFMSL